MCSNQCSQENIKESCNCGEAKSFNSYEMIKGLHKHLCEIEKHGEVKGIHKHLAKLELQEEIKGLHEHIARVEMHLERKFECIERKLEKIYEIHFRD